MGTSNDSDEFKRDAVHPLSDRALRSNVLRGDYRTRVSCAVGVPTLGGQQVFSLKVSEALRGAVAEAGR